MNTAARSALCAALLLAVWGGGCASSLIDDAYRMQHPLRTGTVVQNRVTARDYTDERLYGLPPATLTSEGTLLSLDAREACFQVVLRTIGQRADLANPQAWRVFLRGLPEFEDMAPNFKGAAPPSSAELPGLITQHTREQQRTCDNYGNCVNRTIDRQFATPAQITVIAGGGVVCFQNHGNIHAGTRELALYFDDPQTVWPAQRRVAFGWRFPDEARQR